MTQRSVYNVNVAREDLSKQVAKEIALDDICNKLWTEALLKSQGDADATAQIYSELRLVALQNEVEAIQQAHQKRRRYKQQNLLYYPFVSINLCLFLYIVYTLNG